MSDIEKVPTREEIELRAYQIYMKRGGKDGNALDDWLAAEKELIRIKSDRRVRSHS